MSTVLWLAGGRMRPHDPADVLATIAAEDRFDCSDELPKITAPTLVIAGERDGFYTPELFRMTADRIPDARLRLFPGRGHGVGLTYRLALQEIATSRVPQAARSSRTQRSLGRQLTVCGGRPSLAAS
jgi:pimeloyl-ACP methyl ester carboxylesterase